MTQSVTIDGVALTLANPVKNPSRWIGQSEPLRQLAACWLTVAPNDLPLTPRLVGVPGVGKTALAMAAASARQQELYIFQCTADTRPEDLLVTPVLASNGKIAYHASALSDDPRWRVRVGRRESDEREVMGFVSSPV